MIQVIKRQKLDLSKRRKTVTQEVPFQKSKGKGLKSWQRSWEIWFEIWDFQNKRMKKGLLEETKRFLKENILKWIFLQNPKKKFSQTSKTHTLKESSQDDSKDFKKNVVNKSDYSQKANGVQSSYEKRSVNVSNHAIKSSKDKWFSKW